MTLKWTKEVPTVPGWYWHRRIMVGQGGCSPSIQRLYYVGGSIRGARILVSQYRTHMDHQLNEWAGPIPTPEGGE